MTEPTVPTVPRPDDLFSLSGRTALITGGSSGIGAMIAAGFVAAGARVLVAARTAGMLDEAVSALAETGSCEGIVADVSTADGCRALAAEVAARCGAGLDIVVHNAGTTLFAPLEHVTDDGWDAVLSLNLTAVQHLTAALLPQLRARATEAVPARVVVIGSTSGFELSGLPDAVYGASKAAVHHLARHWAAELVQEHILVNVIAPGLFPSRLTAFLDDPAVREPVLSTIPMGRAGRPQEIAGAAIFLCSAAGTYVTGQVLVVDGGRTGLGRADPVAGL